MARILIACETSGRVRDEFLARGHDAVSCDILPTDRPGPHYQGDVFDVIGDGWDVLIGFPPCTYVCGSGWHWNRRVVGRHALSLHAIDFFERLWYCDIKRVALENPSGVLSTYVEKPSQYIHPPQFGDDASKLTCLWLRELPKLRPTGWAEPRQGGDLFDDRPMRWSNQTDSGQNRLGPSDDRWKQRSETFPGIAAAMGQQWSDFLCQMQTINSAGNGPGSF